MANSTPSKASSVGTKLVHIGGLMETAYILVLFEGTDAARSETLEKMDPKILFPQMPEGLTFTRVANFEEKTIPFSSEPLLFFTGTSGLELTLSLNYVAGIHTTDIKELMDYAKKWESLPMLRLSPSIRKSSADANHIVSPPPVLLRLSSWFAQRGVIKSTSVAMEEPWTWDNFTEPTKESYLASGNFNKQDVFPMGFNVTFTFVASSLYTTTAENGDLVKMAGTKESDRVRKQSYRRDILMPGNTAENFKGFYAK